MKLTRLEQRQIDLQAYEQYKTQQDIDGFMIGLGILGGTLLGCMIMALIMGGYLI